MVTRRPLSGGVVGTDQMISLDDALRAHTINAAYHLRRADSLGSITVGKLADFVELSADPYTVDVGALTEKGKILGTWSSGHRIDIDAFMSDIERIDPSEHPDLAHSAVKSKCC